ncbi:hypothetical protein ASG35_04240 [Burkholderia sp. Leaf177]|uniref:hypothetical protein n=1 Tax=Burkholderia sp. Leaf177 TaxID=1736287 RepID=UPI0006F30784|nr:hypothetical protein [Burkholderia sp. Leaf177]KQR81531.1 hypothetical protein ASG35_04240 [Burkholderia sp. Leaf177]
MKTSTLIAQLVEVMKALGDPVIVVPSYLENRYEALAKLEVAGMVLCTSGMNISETGRFRTRYPNELFVASIVLRGTR